MGLACIAVEWIGTAISHAGDVHILTTCILLAGRIMQSIRPVNSLAIFFLCIIGCKLSGKTTLYAITVTTNRTGSTSGTHLYRLDHTRALIYRELDEVSEVQRDPKLCTYHLYEQLQIHPLTDKLYNNNVNEMDQTIQIRRSLTRRCTFSWIRSENRDDTLINAIGMRTAQII